MELVSETKLRKQVTRGPRPVVFRSGVANFKTEFHIFKGGQRMKQAESLEHKAELLLPNCGLLHFSQPAHFDALDEHGSFVGSQQTTKQGEKCGFAAA